MNIMTPDRIWRFGAVAVALALSACSLGGTIAGSPVARPKRSTAVSPFSPVGVSSSPSIYVPVPLSPKPPAPTVNTGSGTGGSTSGGPRGDLADVGPVKCSGQTKGVTEHGAAVSTRFKCYTIHGSTTAQLNAQMQRLGPHVDGTGRAAATKWKIAWSDSQSTNGSSCRILSVDLQLTIVFEFPSWSRPAGVDPAVASAYDSFLNDVRKHEYTHRKIAIDGADQTAKAISRVKPANSCSALTHKVNSAANNVIAATKNRQNALDAAAAAGD